MQDFPETRASLLLRIRNTDDRDAWQEFAAIYQPVIYRMARKRGCQDADAHDLAQQVLLKLSTAIAQFEPHSERAKFSTWLTTICRNAIIDEFRQTHFDASGGTTILEQLGQLSQPEVTIDDLEHEHRREVFRHAARQVSKEVEPTTWQAFWMTAVEGRPPKQVATELSMKVGTVYTARCRVIQRLKDKVAEYE